MGPSWSPWRLLGAFGSLWEPLGALLKAIWPDTENVEKPLVFLAFGSLGRSWRRLGSVLEASWSVLERLRGILKRLVASWKRLGGVLMRLGAS